MNKAERARVGHVGTIMVTWVHKDFIRVEKLIGDDDREIKTVGIVSKKAINGTSITHSIE